MTHFEQLNEQQRKAVLHKDGPLLILAGAGAGKTRVITHRIQNLIHEGVAPENILAVTFTNKAAKEMRERIGALITKDDKINTPISVHTRPYVSTFHALGVHIIKENARLLGVSRRFTIFDKQDSVRAIKEAIIAVGLNPKEFEPRKLLSVISRQKGEAKTVDEYEKQTGNEYFPKIVGTVWKEYEKILQNEKALDFDDLLLKAMRLLKEHDDIRTHYQNIWHYIHIDEYQDTNKVQYELSRLLAQKHNNICVVGDIDQNIYSWRGANLENILHFEKNYPGATFILLEENYRSTKTILDASNEIIKKNTNRLEKNLFTQNGVGEKISLLAALDESHEASLITKKVEELFKKKAKPTKSGSPGASTDALRVEPKDIAVLYRANFQSRVLEEAFLVENIPYQVLGIRFFERKEVKDILSFVRAAINQESIVDIKRVSNVPPRGIGKVTLLAMVQGREGELTPGAKKKVEDFKKLLNDIADVTLSSPPSTTIKYILRASGLEEKLKNGGEDEHERLENIKELVTLATRYDVLSPEETTPTFSGSPLGDPSPLGTGKDGALGKPGASTDALRGMEKLLEDAALASDQDELKEDKNAVRLMTVHASKGLEFDYVFIAGLEEGLFPHQSYENDTVDNEEERRLFYVALTRARKKVFLLFASMRTIFGSKEVTFPSEFITDISDELLEIEDTSVSSLKTIYLE